MQEGGKKSKDPQAVKMNSSQKFSLFRIIFSSILFSVSFLVSGHAVTKYIIIVAAYLLASYDVLIDALSNIFRGQVFDEKFLMSIASIGAFVIGESHEAVFVMVFFQIGELFESLAVEKSRRSVASLMEISPEYANIMRDGVLTQVSPDEVSVGDIIIVKPGERIPLDGVVEDGSSALNTAALTGESIPRDVEVGDSVISGCVNLKGLLRIRVSKHIEESTVSRILELVEQSAANKSKSENFITRFARWYTPAVVVAALLLALVPPFFIGGWSEWIHRALIFLVISCPCALVISVPLTYFGGIGKASRSGILVKGSNYMDTLSRCSCFVFDKTGTLTKGSFSISKVHTEKCSEEKLIEAAAYAEAFSDHPIAYSIKKAFGECIDHERIDSVDELSGMGVRTVVSGHTVLCGNEKLMVQEGFEPEKCEEAGSIVHVSVDGVYLGYLLVSDEIKEDSAEAIANLKKYSKAKTVMLTGDELLPARAVGEKLGIDNVISGLLPQNKLLELEKILDENTGLKTAYVGDGINDAPCLTRADLGVAMGALGSDAAIEAADVVLMDDKLGKLSLGISIAQKTRRIVKQNITFALTVKFAVLILGALGYAGMWMAAFADVGVCVIAILNAMRTQK